MNSDFSTSTPFPAEPPTTDQRAPKPQPLAGKPEAKEKPPPALTIPQLRAGIVSGTDRAESLKKRLKELPSLSTLDLVNCIRLDQDPILIWKTHLELERRGIPPCMRIPMRKNSEYSPRLPLVDYYDGDDQTRYITWLADLHWICTQYPKHYPSRTNWIDLFTQDPNSDRWQQKAHAFYTQPRYQYQSAQAEALGLSDQQRQELALMPTQKVQGARKLLDSVRIEKYSLTLQEFANRNRDDSTSKDPVQIAQRRILILTIRLLTGWSLAKVATLFNEFTGENLTRFAARDQLDKAKRITGVRV